MIQGVEQAGTRSALPTEISVARHLLSHAYGLEIHAKDRRHPPDMHSSMVLCCNLMQNRRYLGVLVGLCFRNASRFDRCPNLRGEEIVDAISGRSIQKFICGVLI